MGVKAYADSEATASSERTREWTRTTLAVQLMGELPKAACASDGTPSTRLKNIVWEALSDMWEIWTWQFRERSGTISLTSGDESYSICDADNYPDFAMFCQRWLEETQNQRLKFTTSHAEFEAVKALYMNSDRSLQTGEPEIALIVPDTTLTRYGTKLVFAPKSNGSYGYGFWYMCQTPTYGLTDSIMWPNFMFRLWHLEAKWRAEQAFLKNDERWKDTYKGARSALDWAKAENDREMVTPTKQIHDGYGMLAQLGSAGLADFTDI